MDIVVLLQWIALSALLVPAVAVVPGSGCDANHTRLLLLVDLSHDINLTITRLNNIVSYFITKVKDGIIKNLAVCLVDPFQNETFFNLTNVNSSQEITSAIDQLVHSTVSADEYHRGSIIKNKYVILDLFNMVAHKQYVVVLLLHCHIECTLILGDIQHIFNSFEHILMISLLIPSSNIKSKLYTKYYQKNYSTDKQSYLIDDKDDDFTKYNPVALYACRECPQGWIQYSQKVYNRFSCYSVDKMDAFMSWTQTSNLCELKKSNLPIFETEDELMFLKYYLIQTKVATTSDWNMSLASSAVVYTGIKRKQYLPGKPFIWMNSKPFSIDSNLDKIADDGKDCFALALPLRKNNNKQDIRWRLVNCDKPKSRLRVCELEVNLIQNKDEIMYQLQATSQNGPRWHMCRQTVKDPLINGYEVYTFITTYFQQTETDVITFDCKGDQELYYSYVCDGSQDCLNGIDEQYCRKLTMDERLHEFLCKNPNGFNDYPSRVDIRVKARCDGVQDCPDKSDEQGCDECLGRHCEDGTCLPQHWLSRDFEACNLYIGANRTAYFNVSYSCKGQCSGLIHFSHEISFCNRNIKVEEYSEGELLYNNLTSKIEWAPKCLYLRGREEHPTGCHDWYQLRDCTPFECPEGFIKCINSYCIPVYNVRDGVSDCPFGEDEDFFINSNDVYDVYACMKQINTNNLEKQIHIHEVHICDGIPQCPQGEDEIFCPMTCPTGFKCIGGSTVVNNYTLVQDITSLNIFDIKTKFLNLSLIDLSKLDKTFIFRKLLEIHASSCNLVNLNNIFNKHHGNLNVFKANFSYNKLKGLFENGPMSTLWNLQFLDLSHNEHLTVVEWGAIASRILHTLDLSFTGISVLKLHDPVTVSLRSINLCNTKIGPNGSLSLPKLPEFLNLEKTSLSTEGMTNILKSVFVTLALYVDSYKYCCPQISTGGTPRRACHAPRDAFSSCEDLLSDSLKRSLLWLVVGVSMAGNILVITSRLFYDRGVFKKGYGIFVTNLSVSDFVMGVYLLIIACTDVRYRGEYVLYESVWRHSALCQAAGFLSTLSSETSTFFVFLITLDRYLAIKFPFGEHRFSKLALFLSVLFSWILGFILALIPLMYPEWIIYSSNGMCFGLPLAIGPHLGWHYSFGVFICFNFILFICIACGQMLIFRLILSGQSFQMTNAQSIARRLQKVNVAKQLFFVVLSNFLCWFPICVLGFLSMTGYVVHPDTYAWLVVFVMPLNSAVNPMIYTIPFMYNKWKDFKQKKNARARCQIIKPATPET